MKAQGATEYLVLLAVVLIVALVSVALLGFFPGMASDAQITQSQMYWQSATPIAIVESAARASVGTGGTYPYLRLKNTGPYSIRITGIIGGDGGKADQFYGGSGCGIPSGNTYNISDYFYLAPGEEKYFSVTYAGWYGTSCHKRIIFWTSASSGINVGGASVACANSTGEPGMVMFNSFGFEYIEYIDGQQITKRQIGKQVIIKCMSALST